MKSSSSIRVAVIGLGNMGTFHARLIADGKVPGMRLASVVDSDPQKAMQFPEVPFFSDFAELRDSGEADAVIIATPHYSHTTIGIAALEAGMHVLVEKPISVHKADCERLIAAHQQEGQVFAAMFNQRTGPRYIKLKQLIDGGELGKIHRINWIITDWYRTEQYYRSGGWRATWGGEGGGVLLNQSPHQLDLWTWLFGMPSRVRAFCKTGHHHDIEVEDEVTAYLDYEDGKSGIFITSTGEAPGTNRLEVTCDAGRIVIEGSSFEWLRNEKWTSRHIREAEGGFTQPPVWNIQIPTEGDGSQHLGILQNFASAVLKGEALIAPAAEGIHSVELANAIIHSSDREETVALPLDAEAYETSLTKKIASSTFVKKTSQPKVNHDFENSF